jgi:hypothetical protein
MDMPGYPNTLILIAGAFDENGNWYLQPFVVNHAPISIGEGKTCYPTRIHTFVRDLNDYKNRVNEVSIDLPKALTMIGKQLTLSSGNSYVIKNGKTLEEATMADIDFEILRGPLTINGLEIISEVDNLDYAPEYPDLQPVP